MPSIVRYAGCRRYVEHCYTGIIMLSDVMLSVLIVTAPVVVVPG